LLGHAKTLLVHLNHMNADMSDHAAGHKGVLRIIANTSAMTEYLPDDLATFAKDNPDVRLVVEERWSTEAVGLLLAGEADIGIVVEGTRTEGLEIFAYRADRLAVIAPPSHALVQLEAMRFVDILDHDLIALESGSSMMRLLAEQAVVLEKALSLRVQVRSFEVVCRMVQAGLGVGLLPLQPAKALGESMGLVVRALAEPWAERHMLLCVKKDRPPSLPLTQLIIHLRAREPQPLQ
jgi:DNA-binding transcriptional LysR family regulator